MIVRLFTSVRKHDENSTALTALLRLLESSEVSFEQRRTLASSLISDRKKLDEGIGQSQFGHFDGIGLEAIQRAVGPDGDEIAGGLVQELIREGEDPDLGYHAYLIDLLGAECLETIVSLSITHMRDTTERFINHDSEPVVGASHLALDIFAEFLAHHTGAATRSDLYKDALVDSYLLLHLINAVDTATSVIKSSAKKVWDDVANADAEHQETLRSRLLAVLADRLELVSCSVE